MGVKKFFVALESRNSRSRNEREVRQKGRFQYIIRKGFLKFEFREKVSLCNSELPNTRHIKVEIR